MALSDDPARRLDFRDSVGAFATGVTVVTTRYGDLYAGMTLNSFTSISMEPLLVLVSLAHGTRTLEVLRRSERFAVNVLHRRQAEVALAFAKPGAPFPSGHTVVDPAGFVVVMHSLAILRCVLHGIHTEGDHDLVIGEVVDFESSGGQPLIFHRGAFGGLDADALVPRGRVIGIAGGDW
ncbi:MAG TPA: flavin reductase family protein [Gaiellales bacterium]|nr:flavin reductase family protein [Gaiellales bacterium]